MKIAWCNHHHTHSSNHEWHLNTVDVYLTIPSVLCLSQDSEHPVRTPVSTVCIYSLTTIWFLALSGVTQKRTDSIFQSCSSPGFILNVVSRIFPSPLTPLGLLNRDLQTCFVTISVVNWTHISSQIHSKMCV